MRLRLCASRLSDVKMQKARSKKLESVNRKVKIRSMPMYRRPKFLEVLHAIREDMSREADYDVDLFAELVRSGLRPAYGPERRIRGFKSRAPRAEETPASEQRVRKARASKVRKM
jgi:hypothetical protein